MHDMSKVRKPFEHNEISKRQLTNGFLLKQIKTKEIGNLSKEFEIIKYRENGFHKIYETTSTY